MQYKGMIVRAAVVGVMGIAALLTSPERGEARAALGECKICVTWAMCFNPAPLCNDHCGGMGEASCSAGCGETGMYTLDCGDISR